MADRDLQHNLTHIEALIQTVVAETLAQLNGNRIQPGQELGTGEAGAVRAALLWKPREAAKALGISERALWTLTRQGVIPHVRIGRSVRYLPGDLRAWIES